MIKGTIYYDESSRGRSHIGKQGRWVGEKTEHGKRVRMRSSDYNKVLKWVTGNTRDCNRVPLIGLAGYSIDVERKEVFSKWGMMKGHRRIGENGTEYLITTKEKKFVTSFNRLAYAAIHNIDVRQIPSDIYVKYIDGEYVLMCRDDMLRENNNDRRIRNRREILSILEKRMLETEILQRYYITGNAAEIVEYSTKTCFKSILYHVLKNRSCGLQRATDIVLEATEKFLQRTLKENTPPMTISGTIRSLCCKVVADDSRKREYNDNLNTN